MVKEVIFYKYVDLFFNFVCHVAAGANCTFHLPRVSMHLAASAIAVRPLIGFTQSAVRKMGSPLTTAFLSSSFPSSFSACCNFRMAEDRLAVDDRVPQFLFLLSVLQFSDGGRFETRINDLRDHVRIFSISGHTDREQIMQARGDRNLGEGVA